MNILILSVGTRNKIVNYFKKTLAGKGNVVVTDMQPTAPALYDADKFYLVPRMTEPGYLEVILDICKKENIDAVFSLIDPELSLLAKNRDMFSEFGVTVIGSSYDLCEMSLDKMKMYHFCLENGFKAARSWNNFDQFKSELSLGNINFPVFVKPQCGSASIAISKAYDIETVEFLFAQSSSDEHLMIQEFLDGQEIGVDAYVDMISGEVVSIFAKKKLLMRAGETDKAVSFKDKKLFDLVEKFIESAGYRGQVDIDIFDINGDYFISEVNPRFGGGYPHAYECGVDHTSMIINNLLGHTNRCHIGEYEDGIYMMKYNELCVKAL